MNVDDLPERTTPYYSKYQRETFLNGQTKGIFPSFSTDPEELEKKAKECLSRGGWRYASCNAGLSWTHDANRQAFRRWQIIPRSVDVSGVQDGRADQRHLPACWSIRTSATSLLLCLDAKSMRQSDSRPSACASSVRRPGADTKNEIDRAADHPDGELNSARVAGELNLPFALSTAASQPIPDVGAANGDGLRYFQLYMPHVGRLY